jgi:hypothetical protein
MSENSLLDKFGAEASERLSLMAKIEVQRLLPRQPNNNTEVGDNGSMFGGRSEAVISN